MVNVGSGLRLPVVQALGVVEALGLKFVPILERGESFPYSREELLERARGKYREHFPNARKDQDREGLVVRSMCSSISFKAINNDFLLGDD